MLEHSSLRPLAALVELLVACLHLKVVGAETVIETTCDQGFRFVLLLAPSFVVRAEVRPVVAFRGNEKTWWAVHPLLASWLHLWQTARLSAFHPIDQQLLQLARLASILACWGHHLAGNQPRPSGPVCDPFSIASLRI